MICELGFADLKDALTVINDAAVAYKGIIPSECWKEPYMAKEELTQEEAAGVRFYGWRSHGELQGVMGIQRVKDVTLIRHAYVITSCQRHGIGNKLLKHLLSLADTSEVLVGTWAEAWWAIGFYEKNGFRLIPKNSLSKLRQYWTISDRHAETSVVLKMTKCTASL
jgi:GNAT superfamily N-acetyltransferase